MSQHLLTRAERLVDRERQCGYKFRPPVAFVGLQGPLSKDEKNITLDACDEQLLECLFSSDCHCLIRTSNARRFFKIPRLRNFDATKMDCCVPVTLNPQDKKVLFHGSAEIQVGCYFEASEKDHGVFLMRLHYADMVVIAEKYGLPAVPVSLFRLGPLTTADLKEHDGEWRVLHHFDPEYDYVSRHFSTMRMWEINIPLDMLRLWRSSLPPIPCDSTEDCPICRAPLRGRTDVCATLCKHVFHEPCINQWYSGSNGNNNSCPLCREPLWSPKK